MVKFLLFWLLLVTIGVWCDSKGVHPVTYSVIANPPSINNVVGVAMGKDVFALQASETVPMLYTGTGPSSDPYRYVILDNNNNIVHFEPFERPAIEHSGQSFYETYGRPWNKLTLPTIPQLYDFNTSTGHSEPLPKDHRASIVDPAECRLFEEGTIATIHLEADDAQVKAMHLNKMEKKAARVEGRLTYISYNDIQQFDNVELKVGGHSSRNWAKVPYKIKIPEASAPNGLYRRWEMKLRPESTDPTMMREKLYNDMLQSSGVLAARGAYVRLYINQTPVGLFLLVDDSGSESFIRETIHGGDANVELGPIIQGDAGKGTYAANFAYLGEDDDSYDDDVYDVKLEAAGAQPSAMDTFIDFARFIKKFDASSVTDPKELLSTWQSKMDIVRYIRQLAVEWIGGNWDGVQYSGNNFALYRHPYTGQLIMIPMDFDYTFGNGLEEDQRQLMTGDWTEFTADRKIHSYLWEKLKEIPYFVKLYQDTLRVMNEGWNPDTMMKRVDAIAYMIERDIVWDRSLERMTGGMIRPWSGDDFLGSLEHGTGEPDMAIGLKEWIRNKYEAIKEMKDKMPGRDDMGVGQDLMPDVSIGEGLRTDAEPDQEGGQEQEEELGQEEEEQNLQDQGLDQEQEPEPELAQELSNNAAPAQ